MMRTHPLPILAFLALGSSGCTWLFPIDDYGPDTYRNEVMADGPVLYLRLGETSGSVAHDTAGTHDATYGSATVLGATGAIAGDADTAARFDGSVDAVVAMQPGFDFAGRAPFSVEVWAQQPTHSGSDTNLGFAVDHQAYEGGSNRHGWELRFSYGNVVAERYAGNMNVGPDAVWPSALTPNVYHHVVATYDGTAMVLYIDGVVKGQSSGSGTIPAMVEPWTVGRQQCTCTGDNFIGELDELAIYDKALDMSRVVAHYRAAGN
jgi:hypothetical protein